MIGIIYHPDFNKYDLGLDHPLIGNKPGETIKILKEKKLLDKIEIFTPEQTTQKSLMKAHKKDYVEKIKTLSKKGGLLAPDTPAPKGIYEIASLATGGTILAGEKLFEGYNIMINPLGGFHHAGKNSSSGFCFFNDIAVVIEHLREKQNLKRFLIIDIDVHHGNGTQDIYSDDPSVLNISFHQDGRTLYPGTGAIDFIGREKGTGYTVNLPLPIGTGSQGLKYAFDEIVPNLIKKFEPEIIIFQSGVDMHHSDPLADLSVSHQTYYYLAEKVKKLSQESCDKLLVVLGGGYNSKQSVISYYNEICAFLECKDIISEEDKMQFQKYDKVQDLVSELKNVLKPYWVF